jgi:hypothetical protein
MRARTAGEIYAFLFCVCLFVFISFSFFGGGDLRFEDLKFQSGADVDGGQLNVVFVFHMVAVSLVRDTRECVLTFGRDAIPRVLTFYWLFA